MVYIDNSMQLMIEVALYVSVLQLWSYCIENKKKLDLDVSHLFSHARINYDVVCSLTKCTDVRFSLACRWMVADAETLIH